MYWIVFIIIILILILFPGPLEHFLRKNHYKSKESLVEEYIIPNLTPQPKTILDFGSGSGALSDILSKKIDYPVNIIPLDVSDVHEYGQKPLIYDGKKIPLPDKSVDIVICLFVLHHIPHQNEIIDELIRVCRNRLIIMEDCTNTYFDKFLTMIHAFSSYGKCYNCFHSTKEWEQIFESKGLKVNKTIQLSRMMLPIYPVQRTAFDLRRTSFH